MAKFLDESGVRALWAKVKSRDDDLQSKLVETGELTAYKAQRDGNGNVISSTYVKKAELGVGVPTLGSDGKIPASQLPSYVDDVLEYENKSAFPATGEAGKIYVAKDTNKTWRWTGSTYVEISPSIVIGTTTGTAYDGGKGVALENRMTTAEGQINSARAQINNHLADTDNPHNVTKSQIGLGNVDNTSDANKPLSNVAKKALANKVDRTSSEMTTITAPTMILTGTDQISLMSGTSSANGYSIEIYSTGNQVGIFAVKPASGGTQSKNEIIDVGMALTETEINAICV